MKHDTSKQQAENAKKRTDSLTEGALNQMAQKQMNDKSDFAEPFSTGENEDPKNDEPDLEDGPEEKEPNKRPRPPKK